VKLSIKRLFAYWLDFVILASVLILLQWVLYSITSGFPFDYLDTGIEIELWVLGSMSLPVWLYFIILETYNGQTIGKRLMKLRVSNNLGTKINLKQSISRTFIKLLPWEITHIIVLLPTPWWSVEQPSNTFLIYIPNVLIIIYIIILFINQGKKALHDYASKTQVM